jgi:23S rRNA (uracil1939-C5)-methyltransferase
MIKRVRIEKVVSQGEGLARYEGKALFVGQVLPGELVDVRIVQQKKDFSRGILVDIIEPSDARVIPACPYYGRCGGCDFQYASIEAQQEIKRQLVKENLQRLGDIEADSYEELPLASAKQWRYRSRVRFHTDWQNGNVGFLERQSTTLVDINHCMVLCDALNAYLGSKRKLLLKREQKQVSALSNGSDVAFDDQEVSFELLGKKIVSDAQVFFQSNYLLLPQMGEFVHQHAQGERIIDLYSGVGTFALCVESPLNTVIAVEKDPRCLALAGKNLQYTHFYSQSGENWSDSHQLKAADTIIVDPPRVGLSKQVIQAITALRPQTIMYVSCNSATLARDAKAFSQGGYVLTKLKMFDLFAQTSHTESAVVMKLSS